MEIWRKDQEVEILQYEEIKQKPRVASFKQMVHLEGT